MKLLAIVPLVLVGFYLIMAEIKASYFPTKYIFDPERLQQIVVEVLDQNPGANSTTLVTSVHLSIIKEYGNYINPLNWEDWVFNNAGGAMGSMFVLHASISEYLIFFGTAVGTEGHTGRHFADDYFTIISGEQHAALANSLSAEVYLPGDLHVLPAGKVKQYMMPGECWSLELAQGWIPTMLVFGFSDMIFSTNDWYSLYLTVKLSAVNTVNNLIKGKI